MSIIAQYSCEREEGSTPKYLMASLSRAISRRRDLITSEGGK